MPTNILMPALSPTMTEGTLARWLKKQGDPVKPGDVIAEIETDKATMEVEAADEGVLGKILVPDGTANVKVNVPIAVLVGEGESADDVPEPQTPPKRPPHPQSQASQPKPPPEARNSEPPKSEPAKAEPAKAAPPPPHAANGQGDGDGEDRLAVSPLARRMARQAGIDLATLKGSGPNGRIIRADIEAARGAAAPSAAERQPTAPEAQPSPALAKPPAITAPHTLAANSAMRKTISRRLLESHRNTPFYFVTMDVALDALLELRTGLNGRARDGAYKLSVNDFVIKAAAATLRRVPKLNASYTDDNMVLYDDVDISVAVSIPDGLITPIIRQADRKGLVAISAEMKDLGERAKSGKLKPEEFQGGSFSVSNLGMFGVREFTAIINPPQSAILAVGAAEPRPVVRDGSLAIGTMMTCTLTVDHRVADGALGAEWMREFKSLMEDPLTLLL